MTGVIQVLATLQGAHIQLVSNTMRLSSPAAIDADTPVPAKAHRSRPDDTVFDDNRLLVETVPEWSTPSVTMLRDLGDHLATAASAWVQFDASPVVLIWLGHLPHQAR